MRLSPFNPFMAGRAVREPRRRACTRGQLEPFARASPFATCEIVEASMGQEVRRLKHEQLLEGAGFS